MQVVNIGGHVCQVPQENVDWVCPECRVTRIYKYLTMEKQIMPVNAYYEILSAVRNHIDSIYEALDSHTVKHLEGFIDTLNDVLNEREQV